MSIEEAIYKYTHLADENHRSALAGLGNPDPYAPSPQEYRIREAEYRQIANWLQELKERREKESRGINFDKPFVTIKVDKDMIQRAIDEAIDNLYYECKNCGQKMFPQRKEESK